ncbi:MAG: FadR/GntR family transcriptional regulator [Thermovirgaceae bacterium]
MLKPVERSTLYESVLKQMLSAIKKGYWKPGDKVPGEMALADRFGVSRNCIREVMKALNFFGIITARPGQGTFLSERALRNIRNTELLRLISGQSSLIELMEVRLLIEAQAAYWAAERATEEDIASLQSILDEEDALKEPDVDIHAKFHDTLVSISGNNLLIHLYNSIRSEIAIQRKKYEKWPSGELRAFARQHRDILERIKSKNPPGARDLMQEHITGGLHLTLETEETNEASPSRTF